MPTCGLELVEIVVRSPRVRDMDVVRALLNRNSVNHHERDSGIELIEVAILRLGGTSEQPVGLVCSAGFIDDFKLCRSGRGLTAVAHNPRLVVLAESRLVGLEALARNIDREGVTG